MKKILLILVLFMFSMVLFGETVFQVDNDIGIVAVLEQKEEIVVIEKAGAETYLQDQDVGKLTLLEQSIITENELYIVNIGFTNTNEGTEDIIIIVVDCKTRGDPAQVGGV